MRGNNGRDEDLCHSFSQVMKREKGVVNDLLHSSFMMGIRVQQGVALQRQSEGCMLLKIV